jgi:glycosyltransferase involved in cell wall biosynthesis
MKKQKLSVAMIVKNEEANLPIVLKSLNNVYDELIIVDTGSTDRTKEIAKEFGAKVFDYPGEGRHFAKWRNYSFEQCTGDWIFWVDADDIVQNPEGIRQQMEEAPDYVTAYVAIYNYAFDKNGRCTSRHWKERLLRNGGWYEWKGVLHEATVPTRKTQAGHTELFEINHAKDDDGAQKSSERNYEIISKWVEDEGIGSTDPRNILSLANACLGLKNYTDAIKYYNIFVQNSGWKDEIYVALHRAAVCYRLLGKPTEALDYELQAIKIDPLVMDAYIGLGQTYMELQEWDLAEFWLKRSFSQQNQKEATVHNPAEYSFNPWWFLAHVYGAMAEDGRGIEYVNKSLDCFKKCSELIEDDPDIQARIKDMQDFQAKADLADACLLVGAALDNEDKQKFEDFLKVVPKRVQDSPSVWKMRSSLVKKTKTSGKDVTIFCGHTFEPWTPEYLDSGVGGSEEAVIHMAARLQKLGWTVTIYSGVSKELEFDGVMYRPFWMYNDKEPTDVFISWRQPALFDVLSPNSRKNYLWMHDVTDDAEFFPERMAKIDKVMLLSEYHRSLFPSIPEDKVWYTANGLHLPDMEVDVERVPFKMINTSAPDRGIHMLLKIWPKIRAKYPEATLHWYYGWQSFDNFNSNNPERMAFKREIIELMKQDGVFGGERIGHKEVAEQMASSDLWLYPTEFPEISCITAMKAQALGAIPVVTDKGALAETVQSGIKLDWYDIYSSEEKQDEFIEAIGEARKLDRKKVVASGRTFNWDTVANDWDSRLLGE